MKRLWVFPAVTLFLVLASPLLVAIVVASVVNAASWLATGNIVLDFEKMLEILLWPAWKSFEKAGLL